MDMWKGYDAWRLDNNEQPCTCDRCEAKIDSEYELSDTTDDNVLCSKCAEAFPTCPTCARVITSSDYGYIECDICVDNKQTE